MKYVEIVVGLLRTAIGGCSAEINEFETLSGQDWRAVYKIASVQGVLALVWDGLKKMSADCLLPKELRLQWALNVEKIENRFTRYTRTAAELADELDGQEIRMMILKGLGVASLYPIPAHREGGDIDVWLFGKYKEGNKWAEENGMDVNVDYYKHSKFYYHTIPIENHQYFLNVKMDTVDRYLEKKLYDILAGCPCAELPVSANKLWTPPADFNALFLLRHAAVHFASEGIVLRHFCDWALFWQKCGQEVDVVAFIKVLEETGLLQFARVFTALAFDVTGIDACRSPVPPCEDKLLYRRMQEEVLNIVGQDKPNGKSAFIVFLFKVRRFFSSRWKHKLVYGHTFARRMGYSVVEHLKHPHLILKLR